MCWIGRWRPSEKIDCRGVGVMEVEKVGSSWMWFTGWWWDSLLVQPRLFALGVVDKLLSLEPQVDLGLGVRQGVAAVNDVPKEMRLVTMGLFRTLGFMHTRSLRPRLYVKYNLTSHFCVYFIVVMVSDCWCCSPADVDAQVATDAARLGVSGVGLTQHHPGQLHNVLTLPHLKHTWGKHSVICVVAHWGSLSTCDWWGTFTKSQKKCCCG